MFVRDLARRIVGSPLSDFSVSEAPEPSSDLERIVFSGRCRRIHKWLHYLPIYERHLAQYRRKRFKMLEIGVFGGGSLDMWREYFGPRAIIFGIDINPECEKLNTPQTPVRIGSQADPGLLKSVVSEMGGLDVVLDDGSHRGKHQWASFETLFPLLNEGGLYIIEDCHTSYWWRYGARKSAIGLAKQIIDDMHAWYHGRATKTPAQHEVGAITVHDSIMVIEKRSRKKPAHVIIDLKS